MVALGCLFETRGVGLEFLTRRPCGAVDPLQGGVALIATPVGSRGAHELKSLDVAGVRDVRASAEVLPLDVALAVHVVVDRQLASTDLDGGTVLAACRTLVLDQFELEGLCRKLDAGFLVADFAAHELLTLLDDLLHLLLDALEILRCERIALEVVVEPVDDGRAYAKLRLREDLLQRLRGHVAAGVAEDRESFVGRHQDGLDLVPIVQLVREIDGLTADLHRDHTAILAEKVEAGGGGGQLHALALIASLHGDDAHWCSIQISMALLPSVIVGDLRTRGVSGCTQRRRSRWE